MKNENKNVSIIIPAIQYEKAYATVKCLLNQKYPGKHEIIFIYDNQRVQMPRGWRWKLRQDRVKVVINQKNRGLAGNYNDGIWMAKYSNIVTIHEDMITQDKHFIEKMLLMLEKYEVVNAPVQVPNEVFDKYDFWNKMMLFRYAGIITPAIGKTTAFKKKLFTKVGFWDENTFRTAGEDMDMNVRLNNAGIKSGLLKEIIYHVHQPKKANLAAMFKKEWQMGDAHGAFKRKYPLEPVGIFSMEYRLALILFALLPVLISLSWPWISTVLLLPFLAVPIYQAIKGYQNSNWLPGLLVYPILGPLVLLTQTIAACRAWLKGKQTGGV